MGSELLERARELRSTIDAAGAAAAETGSTALPRELAKACFEAGLYGTLSPRAVGGAELPIGECLDVFAEVSYADGSVGWSLMAGATGACFFGAYCPDSFTDEMFAGGVVPVVAGQFAPNGTAVPHGDGFRLTGEYSFGSGIAHADWVGGGAFTAPPEGVPAEFRLMMVPRSEVEVLGNWDVLGLRATSSYDYRIDADVPAHASFEFFSPTRYRGGPLYDLGVIILTEIGHMGWTMGVIRRAIDEAMAIAKGRARMAAPSVIAQDPRFRYDFAMAVSRFPGRRGLVPPGVPLRRAGRGSRHRHRSRAGNSHQAVSHPAHPGRAWPWSAASTNGAAPRPCGTGHCSAASATCTQAASTCWSATATPTSTPTSS